MQDLISSAWINNLSHTEDASVNLYNYLSGTQAAGLTGKKWQLNVLQVQ